MADPARQELLVNLTAALENVAAICGLPKGWVAEPLLRLPPKGASLLEVKFVICNELLIKIIIIILGT